MEREERRSQVKRCARRLFAERGYHRAQISDIIGAAKIARGTFYLYFENKRAIFEELLDDLFAAIQACIRKIETRPNAEPVIDQMRGNVARVVDALFENRDTAQILLRSAVGLDPEFDQKIEAFYDRVIARTAASIRDGLAMNLVRPCDPAPIAQFIVGGLKEVAVHALAPGRPDSAEERARLAGEVLDFVSRALFVPEALAIVKARFSVVSG